MTTPKGGAPAETDAIRAKSGVGSGAPVSPDISLVPRPDEVIEADMLLAMQDIRDAWIDLKKSWWNFAKILKEQELTKYGLKGVIEEHNRQYSQDPIDYDSSRALVSLYSKMLLIDAQRSASLIETFEQTMLVECSLGANQQEFENRLELLETGMWESVSALRKWKRGLRTPKMPIGSFSIIYADPPWNYDFSETDSRRIENQYDTLEVEEITKLDLPTDDDAVLFLWATAPKIREALEVMSAWGFEYKTHAIWDKEIIGMGYWFRGRHELLLVGTKGNVSPPKEDLRIDSIIQERRMEHSKKPDCFYEIIERMFPNAKYLELFAREQREGWTVWGDEI